MPPPVAVPPPKLTSNTKSPCTGLSIDTVKVIVLPSVALASSMVTLAVSLSVIVTVALPGAPTVTFDGTLELTRVTTIVSLFSTNPSFKMITGMVAELCPSGIATVPDKAV